MKTRLGMVVALAFLANAEMAHAGKGIPLIYNTGEEAFPVGPLPAPFDEIEELSGYQAGYLCDIKGVLWSYFSVSNCKPVAFKDDTYTDEKELVDAITAKYSEADIQRGVWGQFGWMGLGGLALFGAAVWAKSKFTGEDEDESAEAEERDDEQGKEQA